ncbi:MAG: glycerol-3-phosphate 1-O-acyltransferase PlsY [Leptospirales bacterium]
MLIASVLLGYFLGSVPAGVVVGRISGVDLRKFGSGNIGFTNALRVLGNQKNGKLLSGLILCWDMGKGTLAVWLAPHISTQPLAPVLAGFAAFLGHLYPVWLRFRGGKGVAVGLGVCLGLSWLLGVAMLSLWAIVFAVTRVSSLAALTAYFFLPLLSAFLTQNGLLPPEDLLYLVILSLLVWIHHHENIRRLLRGEEGSFRKNEKTR